MDTTPTASREGERPGDTMRAQRHDATRTVDRLLLSKVPDLVKASGRRSERAFSRELGQNRNYWSDARREDYQIVDKRLAKILMQLMLEWRVISSIELYLAINRTLAAEEAACRAQLAAH